MVPEPNGKLEHITLTIPPDLKKWLKDHEWVNASGLLKNAIRQLQATIKDNDLFEPLR